MLCLAPCGQPRLQRALPRQSSTLRRVAEPLTPLRAAARLSRWLFPPQTASGVRAVCSSASIAAEASSISE